MKKKFKDHTLDEIVNLCESASCRICPLYRVITVGEVTGLSCIFKLLSPTDLPTTLLESSINIEEYKKKEEENESVSNNRCVCKV